MMDINTPHTESSLLFRLQKSMLSFSDMSSNPVLMPVAVDRAEDNANVPATVLSSATSQLSMTTSSQFISQLEQPLIVQRRSASSIQTTHHSHFATDIYSAPSASVYSQCQYTANIPEKLYQLFPENPLGTNLPSTYGFLNQASVSSTYSLSPNPILYENEASEPSDLFMSTGGISLSGTCETSQHYQDQRQTPVSFPDFQQSTNSVLQSPDGMLYTPTKPHWLSEKTVESKEVWYAFSKVDSKNLEEAFQRGTQNIVSTDGGRYDVYIDQRLKKSVYFDSKDLNVRRGTWFHEVASLKYKPYPEALAAKLEQHYIGCVNSGQWQKIFNIPEVGNFVFENAQVMLFYKNDLDMWPLPDSKASPKAVRRGLPDGFEILPDESPKIDHLIFIVQGIGSFCDLRFRTVSQCVDGFREISNNMIEVHFKTEVEQRRVSRVEFLPVAWHSKLHTSDVGLDKRMQNITLPSIPKLRHFTNDTLIDILLYSTPSYCQSILDTVACEMNKLYEIFLTRNPNFTGDVCVAGHSLGSLILFDILSNQNSSEKKILPANTLKDIQPQQSSSSLSQIAVSDEFSPIEALLEALDLNDFIDIFKKERIDRDALSLLSDEDLKNLGLPLGPRTKLLQLTAIENNAYKVSVFSHIVNPSTRTVPKELNTAKGGSQNLMAYPSQSEKSGMSLITYPRLQFKPAFFFALGSPISMFLAVRGYDTISESFHFPTCPSFYHIFHPYDPVAFRIETLIDPCFQAKPVLIPHHKGRKRMHLEIKENVTKIASEIKQKLMDTMKYTWISVSEFAKNHAFPSAVLEAEVDKLVEKELENPVEIQEALCENISIGSLNCGKRIDYVLQEKPIEALNDYVFALTSHATYWDSEDTVLMILREIYAKQGISVCSTIKTRPRTSPPPRTSAPRTPAPRTPAPRTPAPRTSPARPCPPRAPSPILATNYGPPPTQFSPSKKPPPPLSGFMKRR